MIGVALRPGARHDSIVAFADEVRALVDDPARYATMTVATRDAYERRLNWQVWGERAEACPRPVDSGVGLALLAVADPLFTVRSGPGRRRSRR